MSNERKYEVWVDDNFHYADEEERYKSGEYDTYEEAEAKCKEIVGWSLEEVHYNYYEYQRWGDDPFIACNGRPSPPKCFSAWNYAKEQCEAHGWQETEKE